MNGTIEHHRPRASGMDANDCDYADSDALDTATDSWADRSDEQLLLGYRTNGDRRAFGELVQRYERELFSYLRNYLGDEQTAEDVFQQTFLQIHLKCDRFDASRTVRPWLYTVATHQAIDMQRRNRRHRMASLDRRLSAADDDQASGLLDVLEGDGDDPSDRAEQLERHEAVREAVSELPEPVRQVVLLVYFQGLKYREAADVLDIPVGTVKSRLYAAVQKLNDALHWINLPR